MKKLKFLIPTIALFISPWMHWLIYHNLMLSWPNLNEGTAHTVGISGSLVALLITVMMWADS